MITKAIVEEIIDEYNVRVRIPILDAVKGAKDATATENLSVATICCLPNAKNLVSENDIVFVGFEDNDLGKPIILGHLFREDMGDTLPTINAGILNVNNQTILKERTIIGNVTGNEIAALQGIEGNIQDQINNLKKEIEQLKN